MTAPLCGSRSPCGHACERDRGHSGACGGGAPRRFWTPTPTAEEIAAEFAAEEAEVFRALEEAELAERYSSRDEDERRWSDCPDWRR